MRKVYSDIQVINVLCPIYTYGKLSIWYLCCFMKTGPAVWEVHGGTEWISRDDGNQGVGAGDVLLLHLLFWLEDLKEFCNRIKCDPYLVCRFLRWLFMLKTSGCFIFMNNFFWWSRFDCEIIVLNVNLNDD